MCPTMATSIRARSGVVMFVTIEGMAKYRISRSMGFIADEVYGKNKGAIGAERPMTPCGDVSVVAMSIDLCLHRIPDEIDDEH